MKNFKFQLLAVLFFVSFLSHAQKIHFIMVTQDDAPGSAKDKATMLTEIEKVGRQTGMSVDLYEFNRQNPNIGNAIQRVNQEAQAQDLVWFYYSGHGSNQGDGWPTFSNSAGSFDMTEVHNAISAINCRLKITMYDCCNIGQTNARRSGGLSGSDWSRNPNKLMLFRQSRGTVKVCSSSDNKYSYGIPDVGGFFTNSFLDAVDGAAISTDMWKKTLEKTRSIANQICAENNLVQQTPKFEVNVTTNTEEPLPSPDKIVIGGNNENYFYRYEDIYNFYKSHPDHINQRDFSLENIKIWNENKVLQNGTEVWLIKPVRKSGLSGSGIDEKKKDKQR